MRQDGLQEASVRQRPLHTTLGHRGRRCRSRCHGNHRGYHKYRGRGLGHHRGGHRHRSRGGRGGTRRSTRSPAPPGQEHSGQLTSLFHGRGRYPRARLRRGLLTRRRSGPCPAKRMAPPDVGVLKQGVDDAPIPRGPRPSWQTPGSKGPRPTRPKPGMGSRPPGKGWDNPPQAMGRRDGTPCPEAGGTLPHPTEVGDGQPATRQGVG